MLLFSFRATAKAFPIFWATIQGAPTRMPVKIIYLCLLLACVGKISIAQNTPKKLVINEIHCSANDDQRHTEFVEIYNADSFSVDLSGWKFAKGIEYTFPQGYILPKGEYLVIAQDAATLKAGFALPSSSRVLGNYKGRLRSEKDILELYDKDNKLVDKVEYKLGFPFPMVGTAEKATSLQLIHYQLDNNRGGHWRSAIPSPCWQNTLVQSADANTAPLIEKVQHFPKTPRPNQAVRISALIEDAQGIQSAELLYQLVDAGNYIEKGDAAFENPINWKKIQLLDNGNAPDEKADDGIFTAEIPAAEQIHRRLVRYRIVAADLTGKKIRVPYADDTQPNFAYFVYGNLPKYLSYSFDSLQPLPVCQLVAKAEDIQYNINKYTGDSYKSTGTIVYNGEVYDHVGYRSRGYRNRHARNKRNIKFNFNRGHDIETLDNYGRPYPIKRGKWVLSGTWLLDNPYTHGLAEGVLYQLFNLQNAPATYSDFIHLRVVSHRSEQDSAQNGHGDFWGLFLVMENFDSDFLKSHNLPNGNIYSYKPAKIRNQLADSLFGLKNAPFLEWDTLCERKNTVGWWLRHLDLQAYFGFVAAQNAINNRETGYRKQHWWMEYHNPIENNWTIFPWDMDVTFTSTTGTSSISGAIRKAAFSHPAIQIGYDNHLRSFLDLLYNEDQAHALIDEYARFIYNPKQKYSFVDLDKARWGQKYGSFAQQVDYLKQFVQKRRNVLLNTLPSACPQRPKISYTGEAGFPSDKLMFETSAFADTSSQFTAMQWRLAEVSDFKNLLYSPNQPHIYEIHAVWESGEISDFKNSIAIPYGIARPQHTYRARVRFKNKLGYYSHWSEPIQFIAGMPTQTQAGKLVISELLYNWDKNEDLEFIELHNASSQMLDLQNFEFVQGIRFKFQKSFSLEAGAYVVLTNDANRFKQKFGFEAYAEYKKNLDNSADTLVLQDAFGLLVDSVAYTDQLPWDNRADGRGFSLELLSSKEDNSLPHQWRASKIIGGTPAASPQTQSEPAPPAAKNSDNQDPENAPVEDSKNMTPEFLGTLVVAACLTFLLWVLTRG